MSIYGGVWKAATIAASATKSVALDLNRSWDRICLEIPEMTECKMHLEVSEDLAGPYYELGKDTTTELGTFNHADVWKLGGWRYIKVVSSTTQAAERLIRVRGTSY